MKKLFPYLFIGALAVGHVSAQEITDMDEYKSQKSYSYSEVYFGWTNWANSNGRAQMENTPTTTELDYWNSTTWGFGFGQNNQIGETKLAIRYGLQFNWHFFRMPLNTLVLRVDSPAEGVIFQEDNTHSYDKSKFRIGYIDLPIMLEFNTGGRGSSNGVTLAFGGYGGLRMDANTKVKFVDSFGEDSKVINHNNYFTNNFRYGLMGQAGMGAFRFTYRMDLNTLFDQDYATPDYSVVTWTVGYMFP